MIQMKKGLKIGDIARLYHISTDVLRYYEEHGMISPKRAENGYRLFDEGDIWRLNVIRDLRLLDIPVDMIAEYLNDHNAASTQALLLAELEIVRRKKEKLDHLEETLTKRLNVYTEVLQIKPGIITCRSYPERRYFCVDKGYTRDEEMDAIIASLRSMDQESLYVWANADIGSIIPRENAEKGLHRGYTGVFILSEHGDRVFPAGRYLSLAYKGDCSQNAVYVPRLLDYAQKQGFQTGEPVLEFMRTDIHISEQIQEHITELQLFIGASRVEE